MHNYSSATHDPAPGASPVSRRRAVGGLMLAAALLGATAAATPSSAATTVPDPAVEPVTLRVGIVPVAGQILTHNAIASGIFEAEGITIELTEATTGSELVAALVGGSLDMVFAPYASVMQAASAGHDVVFIGANQADATVLQGDGTYRGFAGVGVRDDSGITSAADLAGKTLAVNGLRNQNHLAAMVWLDAAGVEPASVTFVEIPFPNQGLALREKQVDAAFMADPFMTFEMQTPGITIIDDPFGAIDPEHFPSTGWLVQRSWAEANPDVVERFQRASAVAADTANAFTTEERAALLEEYFGIPPAIAAQVNVGHFESELPIERLQHLLELMAQYDMLNSDDLTVDDIIFTLP